ncbi:hypothetical protein [Streptomyces sp. NPDC048639]|uniref:hypothetical protein n=1 Tax=Streptomyces sp. NPDC048639 TaxID=3365581 RepID=UPI0037107721
MRTYVGEQQAATAFEFEELALGFEELPEGIDRELFLGRPGEAPEERVARLDVACEALKDMRERGENGDEIAAWDALYAEALTRTIPLLRSATRRRRAPWTGEAA